MEVKPQLGLQLHTVDILKVDFNSSKSYDKKSQINFDLTANVFYPEKEGKRFKIIMQVVLESEKFFHLEVLAIGEFQYGSDITDEVKAAFVNTNAPAIMFPYVRSFITTFTANLGMATGPVIIPTQFFKGKLDELPEEYITED